MGTPGESTSDGRFSSVLRHATRSAHRNAEHAEFVRALLESRINQDGYAAMLAQNYAIYQVLEEAAEILREDSIAGPFVMAELVRLPALQADLQALLGNQWRESVTTLEATERYCARLREVCFTSPGGFIAHHYTRYLGDLSGGQAIGGIVRRGLFRGELAGTAFYRFDDIANIADFKIRYRRLLDELPLDEGHLREVVDETVLAFSLNSEVFGELGSHMSTYLAA